MGKIKVDLEDGGAFPELNDDNTHILSDQDLDLAWVSNPLDDDGKPLGYPMVAMHLKLPDGYHMFWSGKLEAFIDAAKAFNDKVIATKENK